MLDLCALATLSIVKSRITRKMYVVELIFLSIQSLSESWYTSLCRIGCDKQEVKEKPYKSTTNMLKAYLSTQPSPLSAFMISTTCGVAQKPRGKQFNKKVCSSESTINFLLFCLFYSTTIT